MCKGVKLIELWLFQQVYDQQVYDQQVYDQQVYDQQVYEIFVGITILYSL
jgi:hypothetical protein